MAEPEPCASCAALRRDNAAMIEVLDVLSEVRRAVVARVEIDMPRPGAIVLYVVTSRAASDETLAALIVSQLHAARTFGKIVKKKATHA